MLMLLFVLCLQSADPIDVLKPGEWYEVPNSRLAGVLPNPLPQTGYGGPGAIMGAWNGAAYDTRRDQLVIAACGGHADYSGNEVYVFSLSNGSWTRVTDPSPTSTFQTQASSDVNPDNTPPSAHTYDGLTYMANVDRVFLHGGSRWWDGSTVETTWFFDPVGHGWTRKIDMLPQFLGVTSAYDPVTGHVWIRAYNQILEYDPIADSVVPRTGQDAGLGGGHTKLALDAQRRRLVLIGAGLVYSYDLSVNGTIPQVQLNTTGDTQILSNGAPGFEYDPVSGLFVAWAGGTDVFTLDFDARVWTRRSPAATNAVTPTPANMNGTYGRFRYSPARNVFVAVNSIDEDVFVYRLAAGTGTGGGGGSGAGPGSPPPSAGGAGGGSGGGSGHPKCGSVGLDLLVPLGLLAALARRNNN